MISQWPHRDIPAAIGAGIRAVSLVLAIAAVAVVKSEGASGAELTPEDVSSAIAQRFNVKVLRVAPIAQDGHKAYSVAVMNAGGNFNEAFQVNTLVVDAATGELIPQFRNNRVGYDLPEPANRAIPDNSGGAIRRMTFQER